MKAFLASVGVDSPFTRFLLYALLLHCSGCVFSTLLICEIEGAYSQNKDSKDAKYGKEWEIVEVKHGFILSFVIFFLREFSGLPDSLEVSIPVVCLIPDSLD
jgi:hypothetical protein